ncbi:MAG: leucine-rich repeat domain-containing protein, partial [Promethearchaeota archaeon]
NDNLISELKNLEPLIRLKELNLSWNQIRELKGLEQLKNLQKLWLYENEIRELKGLEQLTNLKKLYISGNPLIDYERHLIWKNAQEVVKYCQEKTRNTNSN